MQLLTKNAMIQSGPWKDMSGISFDAEWLKKELYERINKIDWKIMRGDVERFIPKREQESLNLWEPGFFLYHVEQIIG